MKIEGDLNLKHDNCEYIMFYKGRLVSISGMLFSMYMDKSDVSVKISDKYSGKVLFNEVGELYKNKIQSKFYSYHINDKDLEQVLWDNIGYKIIIEIKNVTR